MKRLILLLSLFATQSFGVVIKESKSNTPIDFYTAPSGVVTKQASISSAGVLQVDAITNAAGTGAPSLRYGVSDTYVGTSPEVGGSSPFQLAVTHKRHQAIYPGGAITIRLPSVGVAAGDTWRITNRSTNKISITDSAGFALNEITFGTIELVALANTPTGSSSWFVPRAESNEILFTPTTGVSGYTIDAGNTLAVYYRKGSRVFVDAAIRFSAIPSANPPAVFGASSPPGLSLDGLKIGNDYASQWPSGVCMFVAVSGTDAYYLGEFNSVSQTCNGSEARSNWSFSSVGGGVPVATGLTAGSIRIKMKYDYPVVEWRSNP